MHRFAFWAPSLSAQADSTCTSRQGYYFWGHPMSQTHLSSASLTTCKVRLKLLLSKVAAWARRAMAVKWHWKAFPATSAITSHYCCASGGAKRLSQARLSLSKRHKQALVEALRAAESCPVCFCCSWNVSVLWAPLQSSESVSYRGRPVAHTPRLDWILLRPSFGARPHFRHQREWFSDWCSRCSQTHVLRGYGP